jgi:ketosteroid isomerase-like protein
MSQENIEIIRRGYELFAAGEIEAVASLFAENVELPDAGGLGIVDTAPGTRRGPEGFLRGTDDAREAFDEFRVDPEEFIDAGEAVVVPVRISGRGRASGAKQEARLVHVWTLSDGKVIRNEIYRTLDEAVQALQPES